MCCRAACAPTGGESGRYARRAAQGRHCCQAGLTQQSEQQLEKGDWLLDPPHMATHSRMDEPTQRRQTIANGLSNTTHQAGVSTVTRHRRRTVRKVSGGTRSALAAGRRLLRPHGQPSGRQPRSARSNTAALARARAMPRRDEHSARPCAAGRSPEPRGRAAALAFGRTRPKALARGRLSLVEQRSRLLLLLHERVARVLGEEVLLLWG